MFSFKQHRCLTFLLEMPYQTTDTKKTIDYEEEKAFVHEDFLDFINDIPLEELEKKEELIKNNLWKEVRNLLITIYVSLFKKDENLSSKEIEPLQIKEKVYKGRYVGDVYLNHLITFYSSPVVTFTGEDKPPQLRFNQLKLVDPSFKQKSLQFLLGIEKHLSGTQNFSEQLKNNLWNKIVSLKNPKKWDEED